MVHFTPDAPHPIQAATVPLFCHHIGGDLIPDRSGVLLSLGGRNLLATAEHDIQLEDGRQLFTSGSDLVYHRENARGKETIQLDIVDALHDTDADFTVLELGPRCVAELTDARKHFLAVGELRIVTGYRNERFVMLGYPLELVDTTPNRWSSPDLRSLAQFCWFETTPIDVAHRPNVAERLFLRFPVGLARPDGIPMPNDQIRGASGCGMWLLTNEQGQVVPKLAGIFGWFTPNPGSKPEWVRGVTLAPVLRAIQNKWPDTESDIRSMLTYP